MVRQIRGKAESGAVSSVDETSRPKVFISYSHDSEEHRQRVLLLANRLRAESVDCRIDRYEMAPPEGWIRWMERQIEESDFVLIVCTETYLRRARGSEAPGVGLGATFEGGLIIQDLYDAALRNEKYIPIQFTKRVPANIPRALRGTTCYVVDRGYEALYRHLTGQREVIAPPLGAFRLLPPSSPEARTRSPKRHPGRPRYPRYRRHGSLHCRRPEYPRLRRCRNRRRSCLCKGGDDSVGQPSAFWDSLCWCFAHSSGGYATSPRASETSSKRADSISASWTRRTPWRSSTRP